MYAQAGPSGRHPGEDPMHEVSATEHPGQALMTFAMVHPARPHIAAALRAVFLAYTSLGVMLSIGAP